MATKKASGTKSAAKRPKQVDLIPDRGNPVLDGLAHDYAEVRDDRIALNRREHDLKEAIRLEMHKYGKPEYKYGGVTIKLVSGEEEVKVKIKSDDVEITEE